MGDRGERDSVYRAGIAGISFEDPEDFYRIGRIYALGQGRPASLVDGYVWLRYAAARGSRRASQLLREITAEMDHAELCRARRVLRLIDPEADRHDPAATHAASEGESDRKGESDRRIA